MWASEQIEIARETCDLSLLMKIHRYQYNAIKLDCDIFHSIPLQTNNNKVKSVIVNKKWNQVLPNTSFSVCENHKCITTNDNNERTDNTEDSTFDKHKETLLVEKLSRQIPGQIEYTNDKDEQFFTTRNDLMWFLYSSSAYYWQSFRQKLTNLFYHLLQKSKTCLVTTLTGSNFFILHDRLHIINLKDDIIHCIFIELDEEYGTWTIMITDDDDIHVKHYNTDIAFYQFDELYTQYIVLNNH